MPPCEQDFYQEHPKISRHKAWLSSRTRLRPFFPSRSPVLLLLSQVPRSLSTSLCSQADPYPGYFNPGIFCLDMNQSFLLESVAGNPWRLLVAVTLLNKTTAKVAIPVFYDLIERWPTPWAMSQGQQLCMSCVVFVQRSGQKASKEELRNYLYHLGIYNVRSRRLIEMSKAYIVDPPSQNDTRPPRTFRTNRHTSSLHNKSCLSTPISHLPGTGPYALDSYRIFCPSHQNPFCEEWKTVRPADKELMLYLVSSLVYLKLDS